MGGRDRTTPEADLPDFGEDGPAGEWRSAAEEWDRCLADLRYARTSDLCVDLATRDGRQFPARVDAVDPAGRWVEVVVPEFGAGAVAARLEAGDLRQVRVSRARW